MKLSTAAAALEDFVGGDLTDTVSQIERSICGTNLKKCASVLDHHKVNHELLAAAGLIKLLAGQVNVTIHALGILLCLPSLLEQGEIVDYVSLGAGNTGRAFDLETNKRVAEFEFIRWRGGAESIRQNGLFKDFYSLAEHETNKKKFVYVLGTKYPLKFLNGGRAMASVFSRNVKLLKDFQSKYPEYKRVREYYVPNRDRVQVVDVSALVPELQDEGGIHHEPETIY